MLPLQDDTQSTVNVNARRLRHRRLMKENPFLWIKSIRTLIGNSFRLLNVFDLFAYARKPSAHVRFLESYLRSRYVAFANLPCDEKLIRKVSYIVVTLFTLSSLNIYSFTFENVYAGDESFATAQSVFSDEEGYLTKSMPTGERNYAGRDSIVTHKVENGETLSGIAYMYGIRTVSILDNNPGLGSGNYLKAGNELTIPPQDGYLYKVKKGDTLSEISKKFALAEDKIIAANPELAEGLQADSILLLAGARAPQSARTVAGGNSGAIVGSVPASQAPNSWGFVTPTPVNARYSRGFTSWHPGLDISRSDKSYSPNVVTPISGKIIKVRQTGWNGGYGTHLVLEREDGVQVLMAHFVENKIYVNEGDQVVAGQVVGLMGTTGRSSGVHLHVEVIVDGVKRNPLNYFSI